MLFQDSFTRHLLHVSSVFFLLNIMKWMSINFPFIQQNLSTSSFNQQQLPKHSTTTCRESFSHRGVQILLSSMSAQRPFIHEWEQKSPGKCSGFSEGPMRETFYEESHWTLKMSGTEVGQDFSSLCCMGHQHRQKPFHMYITVMHIR